MDLSQNNVNGRGSVSVKQNTQENLCISSCMAESAVSFKGLASEESDDMKKVFLCGRSRRDQENWKRSQQSNISKESLV